MIFLATIDLLVLVALLVVLCVTFFQVGRSFERAVLGASTRKNGLDK